MDTASILGNLHVLVIDDDDGMRDLLSRMLQRMKIAGVTAVRRVGDAFRHLDDGASVSLVICDWNMAGLSGIDFFKKLRSIRPELPFLMLTGRGDPTSLLTAKQLGVSAYLVKPVTAQELQAAICRIVPAPCSPSPSHLA